MYEIFITRLQVPVNRRYNLETLTATLRKRFPRGTHDHVLIAYTMYVVSCPPLVRSLCPLPAINAVSLLYEIRTRNNLQAQGRE